jgi:hypothetical protein
MHKGLTTLLAATLTAGLFGCHHDKPHEYGRERPPVDELDSGGKGLQSKDVVDASDKMAMDLLADPQLNASKTQYTIVVDHVDNQTHDPRANLDIFIQRLRTELFQQGRGKVQLIENRDKLHELQSKELEGNEREDTFGQGSGAKPAPGPAGIQPDYSLYAVMMDMPDRNTNYYFCRFTLTDLRNRTVAWENSYEVKVAR